MNITHTMANDTIAQRPKRHYYSPAATMVVRERPTFTPTNSAERFADAKRQG